MLCSIIWRAQKIIHQIKTTLTRDIPRTNHLPLPNLFRRKCLKFGRLKRNEAVGNSDSNVTALDRYGASINELPTSLPSPLENPCLTQAAANLFVGVEKQVTVLFQAFEGRKRTTLDHSETAARDKPLPLGSAFTL